jgi:hypothetical protein
VDFDTTVADEAEKYLRQLDAMTRDPQSGECLRCFVDRMVAAHGCDTSRRFTTRWLKAAGTADRDQVLRWFESRGGYCDCEVIMNALPGGHWSPPVRDG